MKIKEVTSMNDLSKKELLEYYQWVVQQELDNAKKLMENANVN